MGLPTGNHVASNLILYATASVILTGAFAFMRRRRMLRNLEEQARSLASQRKAEELETSAATGAVNGGLRGALGGAALAFVFAPVMIPFLALGAVAGGLSGASDARDETLIAQASRPDLDPAERKRLQREATRISGRVLASSLGKSLAICLIVGLMTYQRSPGWNFAREMELRTELAIAWAACKLEPEDTHVLELAPTGRPNGEHQRNLCDDLLEVRKSEAEAQIEARLGSASTVSTQSAPTIPAAH